MITILLFVSLLFSVSSCQQSTTESGSNLSRIGLTVNNNKNGVEIVSYTLKIKTSDDNKDGAVVVGTESKREITKTEQYGNKIDNIKLKATGDYTLELSLTCRKDGKEQKCYETKAPYTLKTRNKDGTIINPVTTEGLVLVSVKDDGSGISPEQPPTVENVPPSGPDTDSDFSITASASIVVSEELGPATTN